MPFAGPALEAPVNLTKVLSNGLGSKPDDVALVSLKTRWTWRQLENTSGRLAHNLLGLGLEQGDRVASLMPNRAASVIHYLACMRAGLVAMPLNYRYTPPEIDFALSQGGASVLFVHAERAEDIAASRETNRLPRGIISYGGPLGDNPTFAQLIEDDPRAAELKPPDFGAPALIFFTSGSTGKPKGVTHSLNSFGSLVASNAKTFELTSNDTVLPATSLSHVAAVHLTLASLSVGARVNVARTLDSDGLLPLLRETRPTVMMTLPVTLFDMISSPETKGGDLRSLRLCLAGGDKVAAGLEKDFTERSGLRVNEIYGLTEMGTSHCNPMPTEAKLGSIGLTAAGYVSSIRAEDGHEVPTGAEGQLWLKGPAMMLGYWNNSTASAEVMRDGWLDTGDLMRADRDAYFWFCGRRKQIIVHDASNILPQEIEEALMAHPAVAMAGVVGVHDDVHGENVWAYVTLKQGAKQPTSGELIRFARERVGYKAPEVIKVLDKMPLTADGKLDRVSLKQRAADEVGGAHAG